MVHRNNQDELPAIRSAATAAGLLMALGILAMTIGLIRGETAGDLRTLTAAGITGRTRRTLTAYLARTAGYDNDLGSRSCVPLPQLTVILAGLPLVGATGVSHPALARRPLTADVSETRSPATASCRDAAGMASALISSPLGLTTAASALLSRSASWRALVTA